MYFAKAHEGRSRRLLCGFETSAFAVFQALGTDNLERLAFHYRAAFIAAN